MKYVDPDGEWVHLVIGAVVGGVVNWIAHGAEFTWEGLGYFGIGAVAGAVGGIAGQAVAGAVGAAGFAGGALTGGAAGFSGGFVTGAGNAWIGGASFGDGLVSGLQAGAIGGLTGGIIGGVAGGINAVKHGGDFWTGDGATFDVYDIERTSNRIKTGEGMEYSQEYAEYKSGKWFKEHEKHVNKLYSDGSIPPGYTKDGDIVYNTDMLPVRGSAVYKSSQRATDVYLYKAAFTSKEQLYFTMGHEYLHAAYFATGLRCTKTHRANIRHWEYHQALDWNWRVDYYGGRYFDYEKFYNPKYHYHTVGFYTLMFRPWL